MTRDPSDTSQQLPFGPYLHESVETVAVMDPDYLADLVREGVGPTDLRAEAARALAHRDRLMTARWSALLTAAGASKLANVSRNVRAASVIVALVLSALLVGTCVDRTSGVRDVGALAARSLPEMKPRGAYGDASEISAESAARGAPSARSVPPTGDRPTESMDTMDAGSGGLEPRAPQGVGPPADLPEGEFRSGDVQTDSGGTDTCGSRVAGAITAEAAHDWIDTYQAVEFRVVRAKDTGRVTFLNSHDPYQGHFYVAIFPSDYDRFPDHPVRHFDGRCIVVQGSIELFRGTPQIVLHDPADVRLVGDKPDA